MDCRSDVQQRGDSGGDRRHFSLSCLLVAGIGVAWQSPICLSNSAVGVKVRGLARACRLPFYPAILFAGS